MIDNGLVVTKRSKRKAAITSFTAPTATVQQIAAASNKRVRIRFRTDGTNLVTLSQFNPLSGTQNLRIAPTYAELTLDINRDGDIVQGPWFAQATGAAVNIGVIETMED